MRCVSQAKNVPKVSPTNWTFVLDKETRAIASQALSTTTHVQSKQ